MGVRDDGGRSSFGVPVDGYGATLVAGAPPIGAAVVPAAG
jgi:hypothetical protein